MRPPKTLRNFTKNFTKLYETLRKLAKRVTSLRTSLQNFTPMDFYFPSAFLCLNFAVSISDERQSAPLYDILIHNYFKSIIMTEVQIFQNPEFGAIRTVSDEQGNPYFA